MRLLKPVLAVCASLALGVAFPIAALAAFYHDVQHAVPILLTTLFYLSPVFYPASLVPEAVRSVYMLNPVAGLLTLNQTALYAGELPSLAAFLTTAGKAFLLLIIGYGIFRRCEHLFAEVV